jgi:excisionase family DNA binding protein
VIDYGWRFHKECMNLGTVSREGYTPSLIATNSVAEGHKTTVEDTFDLITFLSSHRKAMNVEDVADLLDISKQAIYEYVKRGSLPALKLGSTIRLNPRDVARWLESRMTVQPKPALRRAV